MNSKKLITNKRSFKKRLLWIKFSLVLGVICLLVSCDSKEVNIEKAPLDINKFEEFLDDFQTLEAWKNEERPFDERVGALRDFMWRSGIYLNMPKLTKAYLEKYYPNYIGDVEIVLMLNLAKSNANDKTPNSFEVELSDRHACHDVWRKTLDIVYKVFSPEVDVHRAKTLITDRYITELEACRGKFIQSIAFYTLGVHYYNLYQFELSTCYFDRAYVLLKGSSISYLQGEIDTYRALQLIEKGQVRKAFKIFKEGMPFRYTFPIFAKYKAKNLLNLANTYSDLGYLDSSSVAINKVFDLYETEILECTEPLATAYSIVGENAYSAGEYSEAILYLRKSLSLFDQIGAGSIYAKTNLIAGDVYNEVMEYDSSMHYYNTAYNIYKELYDTLGLATYCQKVGRQYYQRGMIDSALISFENSKKLYSIANSDVRLLETTILQGLVLKSIDQIPEAKSVLKKAINGIYTLTGEENVYSQLFLEAKLALGEIYFNENKIDSAEAVTRQAITSLKKTNYFSTMQKGLKQLAVIYHDTNEQDSSEKYTLLYFELADSIYNFNELISFGKDLSRLRFENELSQNELKLVSQQSELLENRLRLHSLIYLIFGGISLGLLLLFYYFRRGERIKYFKLQSEKAEERKKYLEELDVLRSKLIANVSHDFRSPLNLINAAITEVKSSEGNVASEDVIHSMQFNTEYLINLVNQMLDLTMINEDYYELKPEVIDVNEFLISLVRSFRSLSQIRNVTLKLCLPDPHFGTYIDKQYLKKIVSNLVDNGVKYAEEIGELLVSLELEEAHFRISIKDNGRGLTQDEIKNIFSRYRRLDSGLTDEQIMMGPGGLGLSIAYESATIMGGSLEVVSSKGSGSTFILTLPYDEEWKIDNLDNYTYREMIIVNENKVDSSKQKNFAQNGIPKSSINGQLPIVLIVEDNIRLNKYLSDNLSLSYDVISSYNGKDALKIVKEKMPDLVVTDVIMPYMNGIEFVKNMVNDVEISHIPVIVSSMHTAEQNKINALKVGALDFIEKPIKLDILELKIKNLLKLHEERRNEAKMLLVSENNASIQNNYPGIESVDKEFISRVKKLIQENYSDSDFNVDTLATFLHMSRSQLYKKLKAFADTSPSQLLLNARMERAKYLLSHTPLKIHEVGENVGYTNPSHFTRVFSKFYDQLPSEI